MGQLISKKAKKENDERVEIEISKKSERMLLNDNTLPLIEKFYKSALTTLTKIKEYMSPNQTSVKIFKRSGAQNNKVKGDGCGSCALK